MKKEFANEMIREPTYVKKTTTKGNKKEMAFIVDGLVIYFRKI